MTKITLSRHTTDDGVRMFTVLVDGQPVMASTNLFTRAGSVVNQQIRQCERAHRPYQIVRWDGDAGVESAFAWDATYQTL